MTKRIPGICVLAAVALTLVAAFLFLGQTAMNTGHRYPAFCKSVAEAGWSATFLAESRPGSESSGLVRNPPIAPKDWAAAEDSCDRRRTTYVGAMAFLLTAAAFLAAVGVLPRVRSHQTSSR